MNRLFAFSTAILFASASAACGGGEPGGQEGGGQQQQQTQPSGAEQAETGGGELTMPDWITYDEGANTVTLELVAGQTSANNYWNYNGYAGGEGEIVVPAGAEVTINFSNEDPNMAHSVGIDDRQGNFPANFSNPTPVFEGAMSSNPTSLTEATQPDASETITFTAGEAGEYSMVCYVPGHAAVGMWMPFTVSDAGEVGFRE